MMFYPVIIENTKDWVDYMSALGPTIAAFIAVGVAFWQGKIQSGQHNLALFENRWIFWQKIKDVRKSVLNCSHSSLDEAGPVFHQIKEMERESLVLFGKEISNEFRKISDKFHHLNEGMNEFNKLDEELKKRVDPRYATDYEISDEIEEKKPQTVKERYFEVQKKNASLSLEIEDIFENIAQKVFITLKKLNVGG